MSILIVWCFSPDGDCSLVRAEILYNCAEDGKPVLHDTVIHLTIDRDIGRSVMKESDSLPTLLMGEDVGTEFQEIEKQDVVQVKATSHLLIENLLCIYHFIHQVWYGL